jgi:hypothetical protein
MYNIKPSHCTCCRQRRLGIRVGVNGFCQFCQNEGRGFHKYSQDNKSIPVWHDVKGRPHYELPVVLKDLTLTEKMLIQRISPFVPVIHIKNGTIGSRGHVVSFLQDITEICNVLPKLPEDITVVKVIRTQVTSAGEMISKAFTVRRQKVLRALSWLKLHNPLYADIIIEPQNLAWMGSNDEQDLTNVVTVESNETEEEDPDR